MTARVKGHLLWFPGFYSLGTRLKVTCVKVWVGLGSCSKCTPLDKRRCLAGTVEFIETKSCKMLLFKRFKCLLWHFFYCQPVLQPWVMTKNTNSWMEITREHWYSFPAVPSLWSAWSCYFPSSLLTLTQPSRFGSLPVAIYGGFLNIYWWHLWLLEHAH